MKKKVKTKKKVVKKKATAKKKVKSIGNKKYFNSKREAEAVAKRKGKKVFKVANSWFVGTNLEALKARNRNIKGSASKANDKKRQPPGRRVSKKTGNVYYEQRSNRSDRGKKL